VPDPSPSRTPSRTAALPAALRGLGRPPAGLLDRVRWLFLLVGAVNLAILLVAELLGGPAGWPPRAVAVAAVAGLAGLWVAGYRWRRPLARTAAAEPLAVGAIALDRPVGPVGRRAAAPQLLHGHPAGRPGRGARRGAARPRPGDVPGQGALPRHLPGVRPATQADAARRLDAEADLRRAVAEEQFTVR
jgi:hypothetical protein